MDAAEHQQRRRAPGACPDRPALDGVADDPLAAWDLARRITPAAGFITITGSFFIAAEMRPLVLAERQPDSLGRRAAADEHVSGLEENNNERSALRLEPANWPLTEH